MKRLLPLLLLVGCPSDPKDSESGRDTVDDSPPDTSGDTGPDTATPTALVDHVVAFTFDGARADETIWDGVSSASGKSAEYITPWMRAKLFPQGTLVRPVYVTTVTNTGEGHSDLLTGYRVPQANFPSEQDPGWLRPEVPTFMEHIRDQKGVAQDQVWFLADMPNMAGHVGSVYPTLGKDMGGTWFFVDQTYEDPEGNPEKMCSDDGIVVDLLELTMREHDVTFALANLHHIDQAGHYLDGEDYVEAISYMDEEVTAFWDRIQELEPYKDRTLLVVTADHGRHRIEDREEDWKNHGDQCAGCRQVMAFFAGPGIKEDAVVAGPTWTQTDITRTMAYALGVDLPLSSGMIISSIFKDPPTGPGRTGEVWPWSSGDLQAWQGYTDDPDNQSQVFVDDELLSSLDAVYAEAPRVLRNGDRDVACWRQLTLDPSSGDYSYDKWNWTPQCRTRVGGGAWEDMGFPVFGAWPFFEPSLAFDTDGTLWLAYVENPNGAGDTDRDIYVNVYRWTPDGGWETDREGQGVVAYPIYPTLFVQDGEALVAFTTSDWSEDDEVKQYIRYQRHIEAYRVTWPEGGEQTWEQVFDAPVNDLDLGDPSNPLARLEHPQLTLVDGTLHLAAVAYGDTLGSTLVTWRSDDGGATWSSAAVADDSRSVVGLVPPRWSETGHLYYARKTGPASEICRLYAGDTTPECQEAGGAWVLGLTPTDTGVRLAVSPGKGDWALADVTF